MLEVAQFVRNPKYLSLNQGNWIRVLRWLSLPGMVAQFGAEYPKKAQIPGYENTDPGTYHR